MTDLTELDSRGRALLEHYQAAQTPPAEVSARVWEAVSARATAGELGPELAEPSAGSAPTQTAGLGITAKVALGVGSVVVVAALAIGLGTLRPDAGNVDGDVREPAETPASVPVEELTGSARAATMGSGRPTSTGDDESATIVAASPRDEQLAEATESTAERERERSGVDADADTEAEAAAPPRVVARADRDVDHAAPDSPIPQPETITVGPDLGPEVALMTKARAAMRAGRHAEALRLLDEHARTFPRGVFSSERELSRVTTLCGMDERDAAGEAARRYLRRKPAARERLEKTCVGDSL